MVMLNTIIFNNILLFNSIHFISIRMKKIVVSCGMLFQGKENPKDCLIKKKKRFFSFSLLIRVFPLFSLQMFSCQVSFQFLSSKLLKTNKQKINNFVLECVIYINCQQYNVHCVFDCDFSIFKNEWLKLQGKYTHKDI